MSSRFVVGIDLGTTNCALAWIDSEESTERPRVHAQDVPQVVDPGEVAARPLLPSFLYAPGELDFPVGSTALPWDASPKFVVGELARRRGAESPARLIASAKSWLSYGGTNRTSPILPWGSPDDVPHLSPVDASTEYLQHLAAAFDRDVAGGDPDKALARQDILLTVPASFDEEARELTLMAARAAGFQHVRLLEEPQAAFYAWLDGLGDGWRRRVRVGDLVLVCDVGGGTTDFSLIAVSERDGELALERVAVGDHILLGGDNMDLALARLLQQRLEQSGHRVDTWQLHGLWHQARLAKETLLNDASQRECPITLLGRGSRLIGGTITTILTVDDVREVLLEGFFPRTASDEMPARARRVGLQEIGLPYAADTAVTRHLARFLRRHDPTHLPATPQTAGNTVSTEDARPKTAAAKTGRAKAGHSDATGKAGARDSGGSGRSGSVESGMGSASQPALRRGSSGLVCPTHILFNGGVMKADPLRERIVEVLSGWVEAEGFEPLTARHVLDSPDLDRAVAHGAAYYGMARRGRGVRIRSGAARSYYIGIETAMPAVPGLPAPLKALCVVPFGMEEGTSASIPERRFGLIVGEPAEFRFLSSTVRKADTVGAMIEDWEDQLDEMSPLEVTLPGSAESDTVVPVTLETHVTEIGTLEVWCVSAERTSDRWKLELNIREREGE